MALSVDTNTLIDTNATPVLIRGVSTRLLYEQAVAGSWVPLITTLGVKENGANLVSIRMVGLSLAEVSEILDEVVTRDLIAVVGFTLEELEEPEPEMPGQGMVQGRLLEDLLSGYLNNVILTVDEKYKIGADWVTEGRQRITKLRALGYQNTLLIGILVEPSASLHQFEKALGRAEILEAADEDGNTLVFSLVERQFVEKLSALGGLSVPILVAATAEDIETSEELRTNTDVSGWIIVNPDGKLPPLSGLVITKATF